MKKLKNETHIHKETKIDNFGESTEIVIVTAPKVVVGGGGGGGQGSGKQIYVEKRRVSFMYFIVDKRMFLLSAKFMIWFPNEYRCDWFAK